MFSSWLLFLFCSFWINTIICTADNSGLISPRIISVNSNSSCQVNITTLCINNDTCTLCTSEDSNPLSVLDGNSESYWSSVTKSLLNNGRAGLIFNFDKVYDVRLIEVQFPSFHRFPSYWSINYLINNSYVPIVAIVTNTTADCPNDALVCIRGEENKVDLFQLLTNVGLQTAQYKTASVRINLFQPSPSLSSLSEWFYSISEVSFKVLCTSETCTGRTTHVYREELPVDNIITRLLWEQRNVANGFGVWYLNNNESINSMQGGKVGMIPCELDQRREVTLFGGEGNRSASLQIVHQSLSNTVTFDLGFVTQGKDCPLVPPVYMYTCSEGGVATCMLRKIYSLEEECGECINDFLFSLHNLSSLISSIKLPPYTVLIVTNETNMNNLRSQLNTYQVSLLDGQLSIIAAERDYGLQSEYPPNITIPPYYKQIEAIFNNSILQDSSLTRILLNNTSQFDHFNATVSSITNSSYQVSALISNIKDSSIVLSQSMTLLTNVSNLIIRLSSHLNNASEVQTNASIILNDLLKINYTLLINQLREAHNRTLLYFDNVSNHESLSQLHSEVGRNASNALTEYKLLLRQVVNISLTVLSNVSNVDDRIEQTRVLIEEIEELLELHNELYTVVLAAIGSTVSNINTTSTLISLTDELIQESMGAITNLTSIILTLSNKLQSYRQQLMIPTNYPSNCTRDNLTNTCTLGEIHVVYLESNVSRIKELSQSTLAYGKEFLDNLVELNDDNFELINTTATQSIEISNHILESRIDLSVLNGSVRSLESNVLSLLDDTTVLLSTSTMLREESQLTYNDTLILDKQLVNLYTNMTTLQNEVKLIERAPNFTHEANTVQIGANLLLNTLVTVNDTLLGVEESLNGLHVTLNDIVRTVNESKDILNDTLAEVDLFDNLYTTTRSLVDEATQGLDEAMQQNNDIINEIDTLLTSISDTHELVKNINSPANFNAPSPYISLQPPPLTFTNVSATNTLLFDSIDLYLFPSADYKPPSLLFYAGPAVGSHDSDRSPLDKDDFIALTSESEQVLSLQWRLGPNSGNITKTASIDGYTEVYFTRVGTLFELQVVQEGSVPSHNLVLQNESLLFTSTPRTVFLIGGQPSLSSLALSKSYNSYLGLVNLVLYNGRLWSLWDYRNRSSTIFNRGFRRDTTRALNNAWVPNKTPAAKTNVLSFDGRGYIKPVKFYHIGNFGSSDGITFHLYIKGLKGLLAYLYDPATNVTLQLSLANGNVIIRLSGPKFQTHQVTSPISDADFRGSSYSVLVSGTFVLITAKGVQELKNINNFEFFDSLSDIQAWFGGVDERLFRGPDTLISNDSYHGCIDVDVDLGGGRTDIFSTRFRENYLASSIQKGLSGTCLISVSSSQVSFNGSGYLSYDRLVHVPKVNERNPTQPNGLFTFSLSFYSTTSNNSLLLSAANSGNRMSVEFMNGTLQVTFTSASSSTRTLSTDNISINKWHYLLIEIRKRSVTTPSNYTLYVDNIAINSVQDSNGFVFTVSGTTLHLGGAPNSNRSFIGCIKDVTYNFQSLQMVSEGLTRYTLPLGVSFDTCPFTDTVNTALVGVFADTPQDRSCFSSQPVQLSDTNGGFHGYSSLLSYNSLPFRRNLWSLSFSWRRVSSEGHMITITSQLGHMISVSLSSGGHLKLSLKRNVTLLSAQTISPLPVHTWINTELNCNISNGQLSVSMIVRNIALVGPLSLPYEGEIFEPRLPHVMGYKRNESVIGFVGCLRDLRINGNKTTFNRESLSSCVTCYSRPVSGWGFTGGSYIKKNLPQGVSQLSISMNFRAAREHGLLLLLTNTSSNNKPILGIGLYEGQLRVTNFTQHDNFTGQSTKSLCSSNDTIFHSLNISLTSDHIRVQLDNIMNFTGSPLRTFNGLTVFIGGLPTFGLYPSDTTYFSFLIRRDQDGLPPRFIGCIQQVVISSSNSNNNHLSLISQADTVNEVLVGLCPLP